MATGKKFYWIKLKDSFLTSEKVDFFLSQEDGANYVVIYQMLCLKTINSGGELCSKIGEMIIPFDVEKIQRDLKHFSIDTIRVALDLYKKLGMVYEQENGILKIVDFNEMVGSATDYAIQKKNQRLLSQKNEDINVDKGVDNVHIEIRDKEIRDKEIRDKDNKKTKHIFGEYKNVRLTDEELEKLKSDYPNYQDLITFLDEYIEMKGYKAKSHYLAIKKWVVDAVRERPAKRVDTLPKYEEEKISEDALIDW